MQPSVIFLIPALIIGGAQRQLIELAVGLHALGWTVKVVTFYDGGALTADLVSRGIAVASLHKRGRWDVARFTWRLLICLRREHPDVVHGYLGTPNLLTVLLKPMLGGMRVVWGVRASDVDFTQYDWLAGLSFRVACRLSRFANLIICNSAAGREFHAQRGYPSQRMVVVSNGIDVDRFHRDADARRDLRREWRIGDDELLVGLVGRLDPKKDHATFLAAAAKVAEATLGVRFICVGADPKGRRASLARLASDLGLDGKLIWEDARLDVARVYNALDLAVSSSRWGEGFPNVVAEAMATEVPCVVTDVGDSSLVVGDTGWVCSAGDPTELARTIESALSSAPELRAAGTRARDRIVAEFSVARLARSTSDYLAKLIEGVQVHVGRSRP